MTVIHDGFSLKNQINNKTKQKKQQKTRVFDYDIFHEKYDRIRPYIYSYLHL